MDENLQERLWTLLGLRLVCHCAPAKACHGDDIIRAFSAWYPDSYDRDDPDAPAPTSQVLNSLSKLREEPVTESDTSPDEGVP